MQVYRPSRFNECDEQLRSKVEAGPCLAGGKRRSRAEPSRPLAGPGPGVACSATAAASGRQTKLKGLALGSAGRAEKFDSGDG